MGNDQIRKFGGQIRNFDYKDKGSIFCTGGIYGTVRCAALCVLTSFADNEFIPTIRCSSCSEWHHRPCISISENEDQNFICQICKDRRKRLLGKEHSESTQAVLQGTIAALKINQQIVSLAPVPGLQSLVGVVLNIAQVVDVSFSAHTSHMSNSNAIDPKNMYGVEDALLELARKAGSFIETLVEQGSIATFSNCDSMKAVIEGLTKCVLTTFMYYYSI